MVSNVLETAGILIYLYLVLAYLGIPIFALVTPHSFRKPYLYALVSPAFGFCLLAIVGSWVIVANLAIAWTMILSLVTATGLNLLVLSRAGIRERASFARLRPAKNTLLKFLPCGALFLGVLFLIILPGIRQGSLTTPLRIGPDPEGYAGAAQALVDGETLSSIAEDLETVTGEEDLEEAKEANFRLLRFDLHCSSEFLLRALRWGYPTILASMTWAAGLDCVYSLDFVLPIFSWMMLLALVYHACRSLIGARRHVCLLLTAALALNCNLLNVHYEGSYAQVMAAPILFMLLLCLFDVRQNNTPESRSDRMRLVPLVGFLCAGLLSVWNEALALLWIVCFIVLVLDVLLVHGTPKSWLIPFILGALLAFILVAPLTWNLVLFVLRYLFVHLGDLSTGGWWQPQWATLPEMLGWINIYGNTSQPNLVPRDSVEVVLAYSGSLLVLAAGEYYALSNKKSDIAFWLGPITLVLLIYLKCIYWDHTINYQYYKAYTAFLPCLFVLAYAVLFHAARSANSLLRYVLYGAIVLTISATAVNGVSYIVKYQEESRYFTAEMFDFEKHSELLDDYVLMTPYGPHYMQVTQMAATTKMNFYNSAFERDYKTTLIAEPYLDMPVAIVLFDVSDDDRQHISANGDDFIYSGQEFVVVKTPYRLRDGLDEYGKVDVKNYMYRTGDATFDSSTKFLLHCDGTDGSTVFRDETKIVSALMAAGDAHVDASEKKFGTASGSFDGTGDYLEVANTEDFDFGARDFTIDGWFYFNANDTGYQFLIDRRGKSDGTGWALFLNGNNQLSFLSASASGWDNTVLYNTGAVPATDRWVHIAVVRQGNLFAMYLDGTAVKSGTYAGSTAPQTTSPTVGAGHATPGCFNGYMDELRISKGIARWTTDFAPPAAPY